MINRTVLVGRLTNDPELKYTGNGVAVATFTVAVNRQFTNSQGEREADFIRCQMWRKAAENFCNFTHNRIDLKIIDKTTRINKMVNHHLAEILMIHLVVHHRLTVTIYHSRRIKND